MGTKKDKELQVNWIDIVRIIVARLIVLRLIAVRLIDINTYIL